LCATTIGIVAKAVKLSPTVPPADLRNLLCLRQRLGQRLVDAVALTTGAVATRRSDTIAVGPTRAARPKNRPPTSRRRSHRDDTGRYPRPVRRRLRWRRVD